jgi:signal transduction histidine kinase
MNMAKHDQQELIDQLAPLALLGEMSAMLAHEYNNLLGVVVGYADAGQRSEDPEFTRKALAKCLAAGQQAQQVSAAILHLARAQPAIASMFHMEHSPEVSTDPVIAVERALAGLGRQGQEWGVELDVKPTGAAAIGGAALTHIVLNLVLNARQHAPGAAVTIKIRERTSGGRRWVVVKVRDQGGGLRAKQAALAFGPGLKLTTDAEGVVEGELVSDARGTRRTEVGGKPWKDVGTYSGGYGLVFCRRMLEAVGGTMWVKSKVGEGTEVAAIIPLADSLEKRRAA